jgi:hypothetical protein
MGGECSAHGEMIKAYKILVGKPEGKKPLGRSRDRWEDIKMARDKGLEGVDWINLGQDRDQWRALVDNNGKQPSRSMKDD